MVRLVEKRMPSSIIHGKPNVWRSLAVTRYMLKMARPVDCRLQLAESPWSRFSFSILWSGWWITPISVTFLRAQVVP